MDGALGRFANGVKIMLDSDLLEVLKNRRVLEHTVGGQKIQVHLRTPSLRDLVDKREELNLNELSVDASKLGKKGKLNSKDKEIAKKFADAYHEFNLYLLQACYDVEKNGDELSLEAAKLLLQKLIHG